MPTITNYGDVIITGNTTGQGTGASTFSGSLTATSLSAGSGTITGGGITGTSLSTGSGTISGGGITGTSLSTGSGTISTSGSIIGGTFYGVIAGSNTVSGSTITGTSLSAGSGTISTTGTVSATALTGTHYGVHAGSNTGSFSNVLVASGLPSSIVQGSNVAVFSNAAGTGTVVISSSGQVGIGTTSPNAPLEIQNQTSATTVENLWLTAPNLTAGQQSRFFWGKNTASFNGGYFYYYHVGDGSTSNYFRLDFSGKNNVLCATGAGNVGIGTTSPQAPLNIYNTSSGGAAATLMNIQYGTNQDSFIFSYDTTLGSGGGMRLTNTYGSTGSDLATIKIFSASSTTGAIGFFTNNGSGQTERMRITAAGNVGIGTASPGYPLDIQTSGYPLRLLSSSTDDIIRFENTASGGRIYHVGSTGTGSGAGVGFCIFDVTASAPRMLINASGNVGIGITNPSSALNFGVQVVNKIIALYDGVGNTTVATATDFYGFGINGATLRYQTDSSSAVHKFYGGTTLYATIAASAATFAGDVIAYSDRRVKADLKLIENALEKVTLLNGYTFSRTDYEDKEKRYAGVVAQEVLEVLPEVVAQDENGTYSVAYGNLTALLIEAIKEERSERLKVEERLARLEQLLLKE